MKGLRLRLFDSQDCDVTASLDELEALLTPSGKADGEKETSKGSTKATFSIELPSRIIRRRPISGEPRKNLFCGKRPADDVSDIGTPSSKRQRHDIIDAVERLDTRELIADGTRTYTLPTIPGKHSDLTTITSQTLSDVLRGKYEKDITKVTVVDCRYPYEYDGGHIRDAVNCYTRDDVDELLTSSATSERRHILVFHCEFSSERGPKLLRFLRSQDRAMNKERYPQLHFPEVYLLHHGYKAFYNNHKDLCDPHGYIPMLHENYTSELRYFRVKSKSWSAGDKHISNGRHQSMISRLSLEF